jgi:hypothetical protein
MHILNWYKNSSWQKGQIRSKPTAVAKHISEQSAILSSANFVLTVQVIAKVIYQVAIHIQSPTKLVNGTLQMYRGLQYNISLAPSANIFYFMTKS